MGFEIGTISLTDYLASLTPLDRLAVARHHGLDGSPPAELAAAIGLRAPSLAADERAALALVESHGGCIAAELLDGLHGPLRCRQSDARSPALLAALSPPHTAIERLLLGAMLVPLLRAGVRHYALPLELRAIVTGEVARLDDTAAWESCRAEDPALVWPADLSQLQRRVVTMLELARDGLLHLTRHDALDAPSLMRLATAFGEPDAKQLAAERRWPYVRFLRLTLVGTGLLRANAVRRLAVTANALAWLGETLPGRAAALLEGWLQSGWDEQADLAGLTFDAAPGRDLDVARRALLPLIVPPEAAPPDSWVDVVALRELIRQRAPDFARPPGGFADWRISDARGERRAGFDDWVNVDGALVSGALTSLRWLGLLASDASDPPTRYRLTELGRALLRGETPQAAAEPRSLTLDADGVADVPHDASPLIHFQIGRFAERQDAAAHATSYRIVKRSLRAALARGVSAEDIIGFLERSSAAPLPPALADRLRGWAAELLPLSIEPAALLVADDPQQIERLYAERLGELPSLVPIDDTRLLVDERDLAALRSRIGRAGYAVVDRTQRPEPQLSDADIELIYAALLLRQRLLADDGATDALARRLGRRLSHTARARVRSALEI